MDALERRVHRNVLIVAFANKLARIVWAVLSSGDIQALHFCCDTSLKEHLLMVHIQIANQGLRMNSKRRKKSHNSVPENLLDV
jgi:hypothetical protein